MTSSLFTDSREILFFFYLEILVFEKKNETTHEIHTLQAE